MVSPITSLVFGLIALLDSGKIARFDESSRDTKARQRVRQEINGAAVKRCGSNDVIAGACDRCNREMQCRHAACGCDRADTVFKCSKPFFEHRGRWIGNARVDVSCALEIKERGCVIGVLKNIRRRLIDRYGTRSRDGIGMLACMQTQRFECGWFRCGHFVFLFSERRRAVRFLLPAISPATRQRARVLGFPFCLVSLHNRAMVRRDEIRPGEIAVEAPAPKDAGIVYIGRIHTPWTDRLECPRQGRLTVRSAASRFSSRGLRRSKASRNTSSSKCSIGLTARDAISSSKVRRAMAKHTARFRCARRCGRIRSAPLIVKFVNVDGNIVSVRGLDCLDGTPLVDLKPDRCLFTPLAPPQKGDFDRG